MIGYHNSLSKREGKWSPISKLFKLFPPRCFTYDKVNYASYLSRYFAEMTNLPEKKPDLYEAFKAGQVSVQLSCNNPFGHIPVDPTIEVIINKDSQTPGGTTKFSLKVGAIK